VFVCVFLGCYYGSKHEKFTFCFCYIGTLRPPQAGLQLFGKVRNVECPNRYIQHGYCLRMLVLPAAQVLHQSSSGMASRAAAKGASAASDNGGVCVACNVGWVLHSSPVDTAPLPPRCFSVEHPATIITSGLRPIRRTDLPYCLDLPRASGHCRAEYKYLHLCNRSNKVEKSVHLKDVGRYKTCAHHPSTTPTPTHIKRDKGARGSMFLCIIS